MTGGYGEIYLNPKEAREAIYEKDKRIAELEARCANHCVCKINDDGAVLSLCAEHEHLQQEAIAAERQACAQIAEDLSVIDAAYDSLAHRDQKLIAKAIRARGSK